MGRNLKLWLLWITLSLCGGGALAAVMFVGGPRDLLLIGQTTSAHHQIELACGSCHVSPIFEDRTKALKAMNNACLSCHDDELKLSNDSHPVKKFRDPRNADRREKLDALMCATCHLEHTPEVTNAVAVTLPTDYCFACHQDIGDDRPSHEDLAFTTCASAGCHNYHDNTALYEDFLVRHAGKDWLLEHPQLAFTGRSAKPVSIALAEDDPLGALVDWLEAGDGERAPEDAQADAVAMLAKVLLADQAIAPEAHKTPESVAAWAASGHALAGVNCAGCHAPEIEKAQQGEAEIDEAVQLAALTDAWVAAPGLGTCQSCHKAQTRTFLEGKHGMRFHPELPKPRKAPKNDVLALAAALFHDEPLEAMSVSGARIAMKPEAHDLEIGNCNTCHKPHEVDLKTAGVEACAGCHDDSHSRAYFGSPHHELWQAELSGLADPGTGVSCADCHLPKIDGRRGVSTVHNQNAYLRPNEKMIRPVCMNCHSLEFAIDALADPALVESNFNGRPATHVDSVDWALKRARKTE